MVVARNLVSMAKSRRLFRLQVFKIFTRGPNHKKIICRKIVQCSDSAYYAYCNMQNIQNMSNNMIKHDMQFNMHHMQNNMQKNIWNPDTSDKSDVKSISKYIQVYDGMYWIY